MLTADKFHHLFDRVKRFATTDDVEVLVAGGNSALTRFANNTITQNVAEENYVVSVRTAFGQRTARATTNKLDDESLRRAVQASEAIARVQQPNPHVLPMATPQEAAANSRSNGSHTPDSRTNGTPSRHFDQTAAITPQDRAEVVRQMVEVAKKQNLTAAGIYSSSETLEALANSRGVFAFHRQTSAEVSITMLAGDSSGWQKANSPDVRNLNPAALAEIAAQKTRASAHPRELVPGKYTVILEPAAVLDLVGFMFWDWGGLAILDQRSFLTNRVGTQLFGTNINIVDNVDHPLQSGAPFDGEGVGRQRVHLVRNGVVRNLVYARGSAEQIKASEHAAKVGEVRATGHGFPLPNQMGEAPMNVVFDPGKGTDLKTIDQMMASTERGVLVTRLWYIREVDPYEKILTGMTRDGTFYVENGKLQYGIRNFRFNESLIHMLSNVEQMSAAVRSSGEESFDMVVPAMKVRDFNFTEVTKF